MKALSLTQPWASAMFPIKGKAAVKTFETRSWNTKYRGRIYIHASKGFPLYARSFSRRNSTLRDIYPYGTSEAFPLGSILGSVILVDVFSTDDPNLPVSPHERYWGDYSPGRFAWQFHNPVPLKEPILCRGALGLWDVPEDIEARLFQTERVK